MTEPQATCTENLAMLRCVVPEKSMQTDKQRDICIHHNPPQPNCGQSNYICKTETTIRRSESAYTRQVPRALNAAAVSSTA